MIRLERFSSETLSTDPYCWGSVDELFLPADASALVDTFPRDHFKTVKGYDGEKGYEYEARSLVHMSATTASSSEALSPAWRSLAEDLLSVAYREAMSRFTGVDVSTLPMEANVFHYGRSAWLGPHVDLADKLVTHVFYFNESWNESDGGCLTILRGGDMDQAAKVILPLAGNSVVLVRSTNSWHAVSRVRDNCRSSRRSLAVTFYRLGSPSTMWPENENAPLHNYTGEHSLLGKQMRGWWQRITG